MDEFQHEFQVPHFGNLDNTNRKVIRVDDPDRFFTKRIDNLYAVKSPSNRLRIKWQDSQRGLYRMRLSQLECYINVPYRFLTAFPDGYEEMMKAQEANAARTPSQKPSSQQKKTVPEAHRAKQLVNPNV